jgi:hypothetical protein
MRAGSMLARNRSLLKLNGAERRTNSKTPTKIGNETLRTRRYTSTGEHKPYAVRIPCCRHQVDLANIKNHHFPTSHGRQLTAKRIQAWPPLVWMQRNHILAKRGILQTCPPHQRVQRREGFPKCWPKNSSRLHTWVTLFSSLPKSALCNRTQMKSMTRLKAICCS